MSKNRFLIGPILRPFRVFVLIVPAFFYLSSCSKCDNPCDIDCGNYEPCCDISQANAHFNIYEQLAVLPKLSADGFESKKVQTDTVISGGVVQFEATYEADYYEWQIGNDTTVRTGKVVRLAFGSIHAGNQIKVTLKAYKQSDKHCFPDQKDTASYSRIVSVVPREESLVFSRFSGYLNSDPINPRFIEISIQQGMHNLPHYRVKGITSQCDLEDVSFGGGLYFGYRSFYLNTRGTKIGCCEGLSAFGVVDESNELNMDLGTYASQPTDTCYWSVLDDPYVNDFFKGQKTY